MKSFHESGVYQDSWGGEAALNAMVKPVSEVVVTIEEQGIKPLCST